MGAAFGLGRFEAILGYFAIGKDEIGPADCVTMSPAALFAMFPRETYRSATGMVRLHTICAMALGRRDAYHQREILT
jgi:hypothetical protein